MTDKWVIGGAEGEESIEEVGARSREEGGRDETDKREVRGKEGREITERIRRKGAVTDESKIYIL